MGVQLESLSQSSFEQYGPWPLRDSRFQQAQRVNLSAALLQAAVEFPALNELTRASKSLRQRTQLSPVADPPAKDHPNGSPASSSLETPEEAPRKTAVLPSTTVAWSGWKFSATAPEGQKILTFPLPKLEAPPRPDLKRRRPDTDVDGFNTAKLACKKRRLLRQLVTSRLSEPFSLPATHILNREGAAAGDKRLLKLAAMVAARRQLLGPAQQQAPLPPTPSASSILRRMAAMNSFRSRARADLAERWETKGISETATATSVLLQGPVPTVSVDVRYPVPSFQLSPPLTPAIRLSFQNPLSPLARARTQARASPPGSPVGLRPSEPTGAPRRLSPSPRLRPLRSPELRTTRPAISLDDVDDLDDESVAFPTSEHESRYGDEPDDVYADFGVIFGGDGESSDDEAEHYEDYLDEVDGIPWNARV